MFTHHGLQFVLGREVFHLAIANRPEQSRLPRSVRGEYAVPLTTDEAEGCMGEEEESTVCKGEEDVAENLLLRGFIDSWRVFSLEDRIEVISCAFRKRSASGIVRAGKMMKIGTEIHSSASLPNCGVSVLAGKEEV